MTIGDVTRNIAILIYMYTIDISQPLHLHHLPQYSLCQLLQGAEGASRTDTIGMNLLSLPQCLFQNDSVTHSLINFCQ